MLGCERGELDPQLLVLYPECQTLLQLSKNQRPQACWNSSQGVGGTGYLYLRCNRDSSRRQWFSSVDGLREPSCL